MYMEEIRVQMEIILQILSKLNLPERSEAITLLKNYVSYFELEYKDRHSHTECTSIIQQVPVIQPICRSNQISPNTVEKNEFLSEGKEKHNFYSGNNSNHSPLDCSNTRVEENVSKDEVYESKISSNDLDENELDGSKLENEETSLSDTVNKSKSHSLNYTSKRSKRIQVSTSKNVKHVRETNQECECEITEGISKISIENKTSSHHRNFNTLKSKEMFNKKLRKLHKSHRVDKVRKTEIVAFQCPECSVTFNTKERLFNHFESHSDGEKVCDVCNMKFSGIFKLWKHKKNQKCNFAKHTCIECGKQFKYRRHYLKHTMGHKDNNCQYCTEKFSTFILYKHHLEEKHPEIKIKRGLIPCKFCSKSFQRLYSLYNHYRLKHSKGKFVCLSCGLFLLTKEKYKEHNLIHETEKNWKCDICDMSFYRRQQYLVHMKIHKAEIYKCITCNISVTSWQLLYKGHKLKGHEVSGLEPKFECKICNKKFTRRLNMQNHMSLHTQSEVFNCESCSKRFRTLHALKNHEKTKKHRKSAKVLLPESQYEKVYQDKVTSENGGKQCNVQHESSLHSKVHKNIYKCKVCDKTFNLKSNLNKHLKIHMKSDEYVCEKCGDTFKSLTTLQHHNLYKHSESRPFKCEICGNSFKRNSELNRHRKFHANIRPYVCLCGEAYKLASHLKQHKLKLNPKCMGMDNYVENGSYENGNMNQVPTPSSSVLLKTMCKGSEEKNLDLDNFTSETNNHVGNMSLNQNKISDIHGGYINIYKSAVQCPMWLSDVDFICAPDSL